MHAQAQCPTTQAQCLCMHMRDTLLAAPYARTSTVPHNTSTVPIRDGSYVELVFPRIKTT
eukprot:1154894-Pelagomonas_calceolata.AAC.2